MNQESRAKQNPDAEDELYNYIPKKVSFIDRLTDSRLFRELKVVFYALIIMVVLVLLAGLLDMLGFDGNSYGKDDYIEGRPVDDYRI